MQMTRSIYLVGLLVALAPTPAHAEWFLYPFVGAAFGGGVPDAPKLDYGGSAGWMGSVVGFEVDVSHRPNFFKAADVPDFLLSESSVTTVMFNALVRLPVGGERLKPYVAGGVGRLRTRIGADEDFSRGNGNNFGLNVGGGVTARLNDRVGLRGDIRYFRDLQDLEGDSQFFSLGETKLDFWRAAVGIVIRF